MANDTKTTVQIAYPEQEDLHLRIAVGACKLNIVPGDGPDWVTGSYDDPSNALPLRIEQEGNTAKISQEYNWPDMWNVVNRPPRLQLALGKHKAYALTLEVGANEGDLDLGGLPLTRLALKGGAGKQEIDFSAPNPQAMDSLTVAAGAAAIEMENLANANFAEMTVEGGAAAYELDFGGTLRRDANVRISAGMSGVEIDVPRHMAARISTETVLGGTDVGDGFMKKEGAFWTEAALAGQAPVLTVRATVAMGGIKLRQK